MDSSETLSYLSKADDSRPWANDVKFFMSSDKDDLKKKKN